MPRLAAPREGQRIPLMTRTTKDLRDRLEEAATASGRSLGQEVEYRLTRALEIDGMHAETKALRDAAASARDAARIQAIRDAGFQLVREAGGISVNVSPDMLHAEADGRLRSGFIAGRESDSTLEAVVRRLVSEALAEAGIEPMPRRSPPRS